MSALDLDSDPTLAAIDAALVAENRKEEPRHYIGMSSIGGECERRIYYDFHWTSAPNFDAGTLKKFADGHHGEDMQAARLRLVDAVELHTHDKNGGQFAFSDLGGHFEGHMDGAIKGIFQAPKTWHVWEHKQVNETEFQKLKKLKIELGEKEALKNWHQTYYAQAVMYMDKSGMKRHYLTVSTPGGRDTISVRSNPNKRYAKVLKTLAHDIIASDKPSQVPRCSELPGWHVCKNFCTHPQHCHGDQVAQVNCRTCAHSTPHIIDGGDGVWRCHLSDTPHDIPIDVQRRGCSSHIFNPGFLENWATVIGADPANNSITYTHRKTQETFTNGSGPGFFSSLEISVIDKDLLGDKNINELKTQLNAEVTG
jgi:hypothetical protein